MHYKNSERNSINIADVHAKNGSTRLAWAQAQYDSSSPCRTLYFSNIYNFHLFMVREVILSAVHTTLEELSKFY